MCDRITRGVVSGAHRPPWLSRGQLDGVSERVARLEGLAAGADEPRAGRRRA